MPTTFADAPIGVAEPPISVPIESDHASVSRGTTLESPEITGIIVAANGILSTNALAIAEIQITIATIKSALPPLIFSIN